MTQWYHLVRLGVAECGWVWLGVAGCGKSALVGVKWVLVGVWCVWACIGGCGKDIGTCGVGVGGAGISG